MLAGRSGHPARWWVLGVLSGCGLAVLMGQSNPPAAKAQSAPAAAREANGTIALTTQAADASQLLYIIDTHTQSFAVYRVDPRDSKGAIKLEAARQYRWDLKLAEFNNQAPEVGTIESMVGAPRR